MLRYNTWLFSDLSTRCLHQIRSDKAFIYRKRAKFARIFQFSIDVTIIHFDFIMSDCTDSEPEIINRSPVRTLNNSSVAQTTEEKR